MEARAVHVPDVLADPEYTWSGAQKIGGYRAALGAPLLHKGTVVGVIFVAKTVPQPFTAKQIELVNVCRSGRHRHREYPPPQRAAATHRRSERIAGAADRGLPSVAGDLQFDRRAGAGLPGHFGKRNADVRRPIWIAVPDRTWRCPDYFEARHTSGICGVPKARASPATVESGELGNSNRPCHPIPPVSPSCRLLYRSKLS